MAVMIPMFDRLRHAVLVHVMVIVRRMAVHRVSLGSSAERKNRRDGDGGSKQ
jgi:hypothetical protein